MLSEWNELRRLESQAQTMKSNYEAGWKVTAVEEQAEELRERLEYFKELQQVIINMSSDKVQAGLLWAEITRQNDDSMMRCSSFASALHSKGMLTPVQFQEIIGKLNFIPKVTRTARQAEEEEIKRIQETFDAILQAVGKVNRVDALAYYNKLEGYRTMEKLKEWVKELVRAGLLPSTYVLGVRFGGAVEKMLHPGNNKELKAGSNK